ncbi:MAG: outer membrane beta-barrel protein [Bacteroidota bacterium]
MAKPNNIEQKIKESFENVQRQAPENLWSKIGDGLYGNATELDHKVKSSFESNTEKAPEGIWAGIDKQLTIDKGWKKVRSLLQRRTFYKWTKRVAAFLIFLLFVTPEYGDRLPDTQGELNNNTVSITKNGLQAKSGQTQEDEIKRERFNQESGSAQAKNTDSSDKEESIALNILTGKSNKPLTSSKENSENTDSKGSNLISASEPREKEILASQTEENEEKSNLDLIDAQVLAGLPIKQVRLLETNNENSELIDIKVELPKETKYEFGLFTALNTTALVNNRTRRAFDSRSLVAFNPTIGTNLGLQFVYHLKEKHAFVGNLTYATIHQSYESFNGGSFNEESLEMNYVRLQGMYQFKYKRFDISKTALNLKFGPYLGYMSSSSYSLNDESKGERLDDLSKYDFGITLQLGQSYEFNKFVLDYGINVDKGLTNLYKGTEKVPASFDRSTVLGLGGYVSFRYKF